MSAGWRPSATLEVLRARAAMLARIRGHFATARVTEVQTPLLSPAAASDAQIESIEARPLAGPPLYLHTSPEYPMKRLLAAGLGDCFQIAPVFRDGESGRMHNPEFTLIEWYRTGFDLSALMQDVDALVRAALQGLRTIAPSRSITYREAVRAASGLDCARAGAADIASVLRARGVHATLGPGDDRDAWLDLLMATVVGPGLGRDAPTFIRDYPASQAALARTRDDGDGWPVAERFELYLDGVELANGYRELGDALEQRCRFEQDQATRRARGQRTAPLDERLLGALAEGLPDCSGVALGFDRLVMVALRLSTLAEAMAFPLSRA